MQFLSIKGGSRTWSLVNVVQYAPPPKKKYDYFPMYVSRMVVLVCKPNVIEWNTLAHGAEGQKK